MAKIEDDMLYRLIVSAGSGGSGGGSGGGGSAKNPFLPDPSEGYTEYADVVLMTRAEMRKVIVGSSASVKIDIGTGIAKGDKVLLTGTIQSGGKDNMLYAVWGNVTGYGHTSKYDYITISVAGTSIRPYVIDTMTLSASGFHSAFGATNVRINGDMYTPESLNVTENGHYEPDSGRAYTSVDVDVPNQDALAKLWNGELHDYASNDVTNVPDEALMECDTLQTLSLPNATSIGIRSFYLCQSLQTVYIPKAANIGDFAFSQCFNLVEVVIEQADSICTLGSSAFDDSTWNDLHIYVPDEQVDIYKTETNWSQYSMYIYPLSERA